MKRFAIWLAVAIGVVGVASPGRASARDAAICAARVGWVRCHGRVASDATGSAAATSAPQGYGPADFRSAYRLPGSGGADQTVAIVDAYDDPKAEADLRAYRSGYGLQACTSASGCFRKIDQRGSSSFPSFDEGWAMEISLDLDAVSAVCPSCKLVLVEASSPSPANMLAAEDAAVAAGATVISNSWGGPEFAAERSYDAHFNHPGVAITASSGDDGYGVEWPAASPYVTAVGGTKLKRSSSSRGWTESAWSGAGSGCSAYEPQPSWQQSNQTISALCARRAVADVSADADPSTGASVYDSAGFRGAKGWFTMGGTSLAAPLIAGVYAVAGNAGSTTYGSLPYAHPTKLYAVRSGSNGSCGNAMCKAQSGWDGPSGLGTPNTPAAF